MGNGRTHRPELDPQKCRACGGCTWRCPATALPSLRAEKGSLRGALYAARPYPGAPADKPPCAMACPLGQDVPGYVSAVARGDLEAAARIIRSTNALPSACGRLCLAACMRACSRAALDEGVDIRGLKRHATDAVQAAPRPRPAETKWRVAVIGAGPSGLAAAHRLAELGAAVTVLEAGSVAGGMLADTVPAFVMPAEPLAADVAAIAASGVSIRTGVRVGDDVAIEALERDFDAVLVATGARRGVLPDLPGRELAGVHDAVAFCRGARGEEAARLTGAVVVLGGGQAALQTARLALRLGATSAKVVHPAPRTMWPAGEEAIRAAEAEGVEILPARRAVSIEGSGGAVAAVAIQPVKAGVADAVGRVPLAGSGGSQTLAAAAVIAAADRRPDPNDRLALEGVRRGVLGGLVVDASYRLGRARWYAAGEAATGAATVVDSMATGRRAAEAMIADLASKPGGSR
jgi:NADPH-dependent glutamate synthase beta subunit-like oxidoreductase